jgi:hypothetical protein
MTKLTAVSAFVALALLSPRRTDAAAIDKGTFALGAERLTGMFHTEEKVGNGASQGMTSMALLGNTGFDESVSYPWQFPRIGLDGFIIDGLSLGGSFVVMHRALEAGSGTDLLIAPRIGFGYMFSRVVGIWPRFAVGYWHQWRTPDQGPGDEKRHSFAFDIDVPLIIAPVKNFAITVGPLFDVSFGGTRTVSDGTNDVSTDTSFTQFGLSAGVVGFL